MRQKNESLPPPERIRVIRRSTRALVFGVLGLVPVLGWFPAAYTLAMHRQISRATGEPWKGMAANYGMAGLAFLGGMGAGSGGITVGMLVLFLTIGLTGYRVYLYLQNTEARFWNPARQALFCGMALAWGGLLLTVWLSGILTAIIIWQR